MRRAAILTAILLALLCSGVSILPYHRDTNTLVAVMAAGNDTTTSPPGEPPLPPPSKEEKPIGEQISEFYEKYPVPAWILTGIAVMFLWWVYANKRPAFPGKILGILLLYGHLPSGYYRRFHGLFVDVKEFLTPEALRTFKSAALEDLNERLSRDLPAEEKNRLKRVKEVLEGIEDSEIVKKIQVLGTRRDFVKHIFIVISDRPIEDYAVPSKFVSFEWAFLSFVRRMAVWGLRYDLPGTFVVRPYGRAKVHVFIPILDPKEPKYQATMNSIDGELAEALAFLGSSIRTALKYHVENRQLKKELRATRKRLEQLGKEYSKLSKELDAARAAARAKSLEPPTEEELRVGRVRPAQAKYYELLFATIGGNVVGAVLLPQFLAGMDPVQGSILGGIAGAFAFLTFAEKG